MIQFIGESDSEAEHGEVVVDIDDGVVGVDVAGGDAEDDGWDSVVCEVERTGIGSSAAADGDLVRNVGVLSGLDGEFGKAGVSDGTGVVESDLDAVADPALGFGWVEARGVVGRRAFEDDGDIGFDEMGEGFRTAEADLFLNGSGEDQFVRMIHFSKDLGGLDDGGHADAVVEGFGHEEVRVGQGGER